MSEDKRGTFKEFMEEGEMFKKLIHDAMLGYTVRVEAQNDITNFKLTSLTDRMDIANHRTSKNEHKINEVKEEVDQLSNKIRDLQEVNKLHPYECPVIERVKALEDSELSVVSKKQLIKATLKTSILVFTLLSLIAGGIYKLITILSA